MHGIYEQMTTLQYRYHSVLKQLEEFKSGEKYVKMKAEYQNLLRRYNKKVLQMEYELSKAHSETITVRKYWSEVMDDLEKEHLKTIPSFYQAHKNHAGETADDYKVKSFTFSKAEPRTDQ